MTFKLLYLPKPQLSSTKKDQFTAGFLLEISIISALLMQLRMLTSALFTVGNLYLGRFIF